ncbi:MAG: T9SS type A sorting domain-containing protein, partial [Chitinophagaceae bacterium]|nr:T9SS type A sorting domain-containing protein [Chitinophagaceae bacterium]
PTGNSTMGCSTPYWIGLSVPNAFIYTFSKPVNIIQLQVFAINAGERIGVYGNNGTRYNLSSSNLSVFNCGTTNMATTSGGYLEHSSGTYSNATVTINFPSAVDSVRIAHLNGYGGGATYSFGFLWDTAVTIRQPFNDTVFCTGNTTQISYDVNTKYNSNNVFTAQLSDASGSFANPVAIGTRNSDTAGTISCTIPNTVGNGAGYRIRIASSSPVRYSDANVNNIRIGNIDSTNISFTGNSPVCENDALNLVASCDVQGSSYLWTGPNGFNSPSASTGIAHIAMSSAGNYYGRIKFYGCTVYDTILVVVRTSPNKPVAMATTPICARDTLKLSSSTSTNNVTYGWIGPASFSSTDQNPFIANTSMSSSGDYIVSVTLAGCTQRDTVSVIINPAPTIVSAQNNGPLCSSDTLRVSIGTSSSGVTYSWAGPANFSASTQNTYIANSTVAATGWYVATLNLNGCMFKDSTYAIVKQTPSAPTASYNSPVCAGETLQLSASNISNASYSWTGPNLMSSQQNPAISNIQASAAGQYSVTAQVNGCTSAQGSVQVVVNAVPFVVILAAPGDTICDGSVAAFTALPNNHGGTPQYQWYVNGMSTGSSGITYSTVTLNDADVVTCKMTEYTKCHSQYVDESNDIKMTVMPWLTPSVSITANPNKVLDQGEFVNFTAVSQNGGLAQAYQWKLNGKDITGAKAATWGASTLHDNDVVTVEMFSSYRCPKPQSALSNSILVRVYNGVNDVNYISDLVLYPNPNNGMFTINGNVSVSSAASLQVLNMMGERIYEATVQPQAGIIHHKVDSGAIPTGIYLMRVNVDGHVEMFRFSVVNE